VLSILEKARESLAKVIEALDKLQELYSSPKRHNRLLDDDSGFFMDALTASLKLF
jgi:hypothetical protein